MRSMVVVLSLVALVGTGCLPKTQKLQHRWGTAQMSKDEVLLGKVFGQETEGEKTKGTDDSSAKPDSGSKPDGGDGSNGSKPDAPDGGTDSGTIPGKFPDGATDGSGSNGGGNNGGGTTPGGSNGGGNPPVIVIPGGNFPTDGGKGGDGKGNCPNCPTTGGKTPCPPSTPCPPTTGGKTPCPSTTPCPPTGGVIVTPCPPAKPCGQPIPTIPTGGKCNCPPGKTASPLIIALDADRINLSAPEAGVKFDIDGDGKLDAISWPLKASNAFIVLDRDGNGKIESVHELFGNNTVGPDGKKAANGFEALAKYDLNKDGVIDAKDVVYSELRLWKDFNRNGVTDAGELFTLTSHKITTVDLVYKNGYEIDRHGNETRERSVIKMMVDGVEEWRMVFDIWFAVRK